MSRILEEMHETARDLYEAGSFSENQMQNFDVMCLPKVPNYSPENIKHIRSLYDLSQKNLAFLLNVSLSTLQKWETGAKKPAGAARKLLNVLESKGISALL
ncbi:MULTISPECIES: helix-turn-helix domain-containing protein [Dethiosulfovibrio]|uniref:Helix-turn-helix domain-containing protein n=2 Tax=Dethiosulfovibrio TaxID=47054 RepID=A0ABS9EPI4_9BACT|nr:MULTISPECIES: helix-turn-helix domain-containing protein [Dethiosulfovibrio]MCF4114685.1 helix-turn-helix domain-containing protein [Dethiosulfovibrio russensis]MCF4143110.1 helix-turn-helix domain-containing protein [Dethiosulfovibrio marinus]MCF4145190.1 helix-turn-helix domain-containing protein [Dethiosulfovibrio acidaminovorans]